METGRGSEGILSEEMAQKREQIIELLKTAYFMEPGFHLLNEERGYK